MRELKKVDTDKKLESSSKILDILLKKPLTLNQLFQGLDTGGRPTKKELHGNLESLVESGSLFIWAPRKNAVYFCAFSPAEAAQSAVLNALEKSDQTPKQLAVQVRKKLPQFAASHLEQYIGSHLEDGLIYYHPPKNSKENPHYSLKSLEPKDYLTRVVREFELVSSKLSLASISRRQVLKALTRELNLEYKPTSATPKPVISPSDLKAKLLAGIELVEPRAKDRFPVYVQDLRRTVHATKEDFDQALIHLAKENRIILYFDDFTKNLSKEEREELVIDDSGTYYSVLVLQEES